MSFGCIPDNWRERQGARQLTDHAPLGAWAEGPHLPGGTVRQPRHGTMAILAVEPDVETPGAGPRMRDRPSF